MNEKNAQLLSGLRDLCAFIEANDDFEFVTGQQPQVAMDFSTWYLHSLNNNQQRERISDLAKRMGKAEKVYRDSFFSMTHNFGPYVQLKANSERHIVCERVVTGTKIVPAHEAYTLPAQPEQVVEIVEWKCAPILAAETELTSA